MPERADGHDEDNHETQTAAHFPEVGLVVVCAGDALEVHAVVGGEEGEGEEDDGDAGEDDDGAVLAVGGDGEFVLFDGAELEELAVAIS